MPVEGLTPAGDVKIPSTASDGDASFVAGAVPLDADGERLGVSGNPLRTLVCSGCTETRQIIGRNGAVTGVETVWLAGGLYPWGAWDTPGVLVIVSDDALDVDVEITLEGLDADGEPVTETLTTDALDGTTPVTGLTTFARLNAAYVSNGVNMQSGATITVTRGGTTVAQIEAAYQTATMGVYSVPAGFTAEILSARWVPGKSDELTASVRVRESGGVFRARDVVEVYDGPTAYEYGRPDVPRSGLLVGERGDIELRADRVAGGSAVLSGGVVVVLRPA